MCCNLTPIVNHHLWGDTSAIDIYRTIQVYGDDTLLSADAKGLMRALRISSVKSLHNYLARAIAHQHLAGEIGSLTCPCPWLLRLMTPAQEQASTSPHDIATAYQSGHEEGFAIGYDAGKKAGYEAGRRARERGATEAADVSTSDSTPEPQTNHKPSTNQTTPHGREPEPDRTVPEPVLYKTTGTGQPEPDSTGGRAQPPLSVVEQFVAVGMERHKAEERVKEFGAGRCQDALDALRFTRQQKTVAQPVGYLVDFLTKGRALPEGLVKGREEAQARAQPKARPRIVPMPEIPVDPVKAAQWTQRIDAMLQNGGEICPQ